ncbi:alpha/beta hydrolase [Winogradskyella sp.]|uniref:alpha/beta fold hydrolase n=1 Tax=Winogradskyella sp. TaxID=1883156 RepID=UPI0026331753|nr:alpha/beta hydrolase [Winogradskyella sp.]
MNDYNIVNTPSYGNVRYIEIGAKEGEVVLFVNGGGAGYNGVHAFRWLADHGFRLISINRPGYYDMPLKETEGFEDHAAIYFEVMQRLGVTDSIHVFGLSMGGLSALYYAKNHPTQSLVLWSAITGKYIVNEKSANSSLGKLVLSNRGKGIISWLLKKSAHYFPKLTIKEFLKTEADLTNEEKENIANEIVKNPEDLKEFKIFIQSMTPMSKLYDGMMDEVKKATHLKSVDWSTIDCPTFAVHSKVDIDVPISHAKRLQETINNIQIKYVKAAGHFVWWGKEGREVKEATKDFLKEHRIINNKTFSS